MARKQETIPEQVVRLYKEGQSLDSIASIMQMNKGGARAILEKHMPDFEEYQQPVVPQMDAPVEKRGKVKNPVALFKKKKKEEHSVNPGDVSINLTVDETGFVDKHTESIAKMIRRGDSDKKIAEFFNCTINDVRAVKAVLDQQTFAKPAEPAVDNSAAAEEEFNPFLADKKKRDNNLTKIAEEKAAERQQEEYSGYDPYGPNAVADPYAVEFDASQIEPNNAAAQTAEAEPAAQAHVEQEYQMDSIEYVPDISFEDDGLGEMPSISTDNLVFDEAPSAPTTDTIDEITAEDIKFDMDSIDSVDISNTEEQISFELKESDADMTASEKMKMFAKQQIEENNTKLESLNNEKDRAARELADSEAALASTKSNIDDCEAQISQLNIQLSEINAKLTDLQSKLSEYQLNENKLLDNTVRNRAAAQDLENSIAEILKENAEYEAFLN